MKSLFILFTFILISCSENPKNLPKADTNLNVPDGFKISIYASDIEAPRQMAEGSVGNLFVGSRSSGKILLLKDADSNGQVDEVRVLAESLNQPSGVSFFNGDLYFAEVDKIWKFLNIEEWIDANPQHNKLPPKILINDSLPSDEWHGWKWLKHDKEGNLYTNVGAPCNVCVNEDKRYASILKLSNGDWEIIARGVRNSVGFDFHPITGELYFGDNGRDWLGDDIPSCELNRLSISGQHFGFPFLHASDVIDPEFGNITHGYDIQLPILELGAHVAPTGLIFYDHNSFGNEFINNIFIALHGSWNRSSKVGYKLVRVVLDESGNAIDMEDFVTGFLDNDTVYGRPSAPMLMRDGSILLSDDKSNKIYRIIKI